MRFTAIQKKQELNFNAEAALATLQFRSRRRYTVKKM
jgi:hypothetical protein